MGAGVGNGMENFWGHRESSDTGVGENGKDVGSEGSQSEKVTGRGAVGSM